MGLLSSASRCGCKNLLSCNLLRCACCCSWILHICGRKEATNEASTSPDTKKRKRKWLRGVCGGTDREVEEPLTSESKNKKMNPTAPEPEKRKWIKKRIWKKKDKKKYEQTGLANLVNEISLLSNNPAFSLLSDFPCENSCLHSFTTIVIIS
jgi:hypothetical protein